MRCGKCHVHLWRTPQPEHVHAHRRVCAYCIDVAIVRLCAHPNLNICMFEHAWTHAQWHVCTHVHTYARTVALMLVEMEHSYTNLCLRAHTTHTHTHNHAHTRMCAIALILVEMERSHIIVANCVTPCTNGSHICAYAHNH